VLRKTYSCAALLLAGGALLAGCGGSDEKKLAAPFSYDDSKAFELRSRPTKIGGNGVDVKEISFASLGKNRIDGYIAMPSGSGPHPAVVYAHGAGGDRLELLEQAVAMARRGAVTLTMDMTYSPQRVPPLPAGVEGIRTRTNVDVEAVREIRRVVDYFQSLPEVDDDRIGFVGWSAGARIGAIVAGVDHRIEAFDLLGGGASDVSVYLDQAPAELRPELKPLLEKTDPLRYIGHASPSAILFQDGTDDEVVPRDALMTLAKKASSPRELRWYDSGHVPIPQTWADSRRWLADRLDLS
jgi:dienelactone hydrolase